MKYYILFFTLFLYSIISCQSIRPYNSNFNDFNFDNWSTTSKSFLEVSYGFSTLKYNSYLKATVAQSNLTEIKYGRKTTKPAGNYNIMEFEDEYFFSSYISNTIPKNNLGISFNLWRFGLGLRKGYGYNVTNTIAVFPYYQMGLTWSRGEFSEPQIMSFAGKTSYFHRFDKELKFGTINTAGINLKVAKFLTLGSSFETSVIFPRYLAAKQFGSFFIELLSQTGIDYLTKGVIIKAAPSITPIVYFILKNGLSYFFYTLKKEKMNWPFNTETPLTLETLKFNITITF
jgi:hypothetical protein